MNKYLIRFNKSHGQPGRGTDAHVWRVFENGVEYLAADVKLNVPSWSEAEGPDWNIACSGFMQIDHDTGTVTIVDKPAEEIKPQRSCDGCTKCCQGHLHGTAHGHSFQSGKPCFFVGDKGCSIYADRPQNPCVDFKCEWLAQDYLPMWFRPDLSKVIVVKRQHDDGEWLEVCEAGQKMDSSVLSWLLIWAANNKKNVRYQIDGGINWIKNAV
jgi:hypothetical protein